MRTKAFYNTIDLKGAQLKLARDQALSQEEIIALWFGQKPYIKATPFMVRNAVLPNVPVTSVRRAMTNLTDAGFLEKLDEQKLERYGKPNHFWRLAGRREQLRLL